MLNTENVLQFTLDVQGNEFYGAQTQERSRHHLSSKADSALPNHQPCFCQEKTFGPPFCGPLLTFQDSTWHTPHTQSGKTSCTAFSCPIGRCDLTQVATLMAH